MGQYFKAVNLDKYEYVCPWCIGGGAKLWEWAANPQGAIFVLLLRKSDGTGGGDIGRRPESVQIGDDGTDGNGHSMNELIMRLAAREGCRTILPSGSIVGRWAGDRVVLIGDYDSSGLYGEMKKCTNISEAVVREWNSFIELPDLALTYRSDCGCQSADE